MAPPGVAPPAAAAPDELAPALSAVELTSLALALAPPPTATGSSATIDAALVDLARKDGGRNSLSGRKVVVRCLLGEGESEGEGEGTDLLLRVPIGALASYSPPSLSSYSAPPEGVNATFLVFSLVISSSRTSSLFSLTLLSAS